MSSLMHLQSFELIRTLLCSVLFGVRDPTWALFVHF